MFAWNLWDQTPHKSQHTLTQLQTYVLGASKTFNGGWVAVVTASQWAVARLALLNAQWNKWLVTAKFCLLRVNSSQYWGTYTLASPLLTLSYIEYNMIHDWWVEIFVVAGAQAGTCSQRSLTSAISIGNTSEERQSICPTLTERGKIWSSLLIVQALVPNSAWWSFTLSPSGWTRTDSRRMTASTWTT